jgi:hypothetical protein
MADAGNVEAQLRLGMMYANGDGVEKDPVQAAAFYTDAAMRGNIPAQFNLATFFYSGDGVPKDFVQAHVWWNISGAKGNKESKLRLATLEPQMTPEQKAQAMTAAREIFARIQNPKAHINREAMPETKTEDSFASNLGKLPADTKASPTRIDGVKNIPLVQDAIASPLVLDPKRPRPSKQKQQVRPAILAERLAGTANIGPTAVDARWSSYGAYLQRMFESAQIQWEKLLTESKVYPASGSTVTVKFVMDSEGKISRIVNLDSTASDAASRACVSAITDRAPYGTWTDDMKAVLGEQQEMTLTFYYQ